MGQIRAGGRDHVDAIVLGRDAPAARPDHWLAAAAPIDGFVGFAIGRSIWEELIAGYNQGNAGREQVIGQIARRYLEERWDGEGGGSEAARRHRGTAERCEALVRGGLWCVSARCVVWLHR
jgi:hypothetical protein